MRAKKLKGIPWRQVIPQLRTLSEDRTYLPRQLISLGPGSQPQHLGTTCGRTQDACQHLYGGRLSRTVWSDKGNCLPAGNFQTNVVDCHYISGGADQALAFADRKDFAQILSYDGKVAQGLGDLASSIRL